MNSTRITNQFTGFDRTIKHAGPLPSISNLRRAIRDSRASDCQSVTYCFRQESDEVRGAHLTIDNFGQGPEITAHA